MFSSSAAVLRMDCRATFGFFKEHTDEGISILEPALVTGVFE